MSGRLLAAAATMVALWPAVAAAQSVLFTAHGADHGAFGSAVATIDDIDNDGVDDILVGEPNYDNASALRAGRLSIYSGKNGTLLRSQTEIIPNQYLGTSVARADDIDGDGVGEYMAGIPGFVDTGAVLVFSGKTGEELYYYTSFTSGAKQGTSLARIGDVNGDGVNDVAIGSPAIGSIQIWSGRTAAFLYGLYDPNNNGYGTALSSCADLDHDGVRDFLVGVPLFDTTSPARTDVGRVGAYSSRTGAFITQWFGDGSFDRFGSSLASVSDINRDGVEDILVGAPGSTALGYPSGFVRLISGGTFGVLHTTYGGVNENFGFSVAGLGDFNGDGTPDYIAGAPQDLQGTGVARVISGVNGKFMYAFAGLLFQDHALGAAVGGGDFNHDGLADVIIGDPGYGTSSGPTTGAVTVYLGCPAIVETYGAGWPGLLGVPSITSSPKPALGATVHTVITNSLGSQTPAVLMLGYSTASKHFPSGATLLLNPSIYVPLSLPGGGVTLSGPIPSDPSLAFFDLYQQVIEVDPFAVGGMSFTNGLHMRFGFDL